MRSRLEVVPRRVQQGARNWRRRRPRAGQRFSRLSPNSRWPAPRRALAAGPLPRRSRSAPRPAPAATPTTAGPAAAARRLERRPSEDRLAEPRPGKGPRALPGDGVAQRVGPRRRVVRRHGGAASSSSASSADHVGRPLVTPLAACRGASGRGDVCSSRRCRDDDGRVCGRTPQKERRRRAAAAAPKRVHQAPRGRRRCVDAVATAAAGSPPRTSAAARHRRLTPPGWRGATGSRAAGPRRGRGRADEPSEWRACFSKASTTGESRALGRSPGRARAAAGAPGPRRCQLPCSRSSPCRRPRDARYVAPPAPCSAPPLCGAVREKRSATASARPLRRRVLRVGRALGHVPFQVSSSPSS